jgi:hypothetical protein
LHAFILYILHSPKTLINDIQLKGGEFFHAFRVCLACTTPPLGCVLGMNCVQRLDSFAGILLQ